MAKVTYDKALTALLVIDPYSDFISEGGKVWDRLKGVAEANRRDGHRRCWYYELAAVTTGRRMLRRPPEPHRPMIHRQEHTMKSNLLAAAVLAFATLAAFGATANAAEYPYCSAGGGFGSYGNCGFSSFEQCRATVMGAGGYCHVNPAYVPGRTGPNGVPLRSRDAGLWRHR